MHNTILTIRFRVRDRETTKRFLQETVVKGEQIAGMEIRALSWGDKFADVDYWKRRYEQAKRLLKRSGDFEDVRYLERLERMFPPEREWRE